MLKCLFIVPLINSQNRYFGATPKSVKDGGVVVCGSMGEVSNDPSLTEVFGVRSNELTITGSEALSNQKKVVWTEIALYGNDQLRQRMAWAVSTYSIRSNFKQIDTDHEYYVFCFSVGSNYHYSAGKH
jgi:hypothetical protein